MKYSLIYLLLLSACSFTGFAKQLNKYSSPSDPGVINQERIIYWLEKRGQLAKNADEETQKLAVEQYLSKKAFEKKLLPGVLGKNVQKMERLDNKKQALKLSIKGQKVSALSSSTTNQTVETTVKVLSILVDFPDLKYNDNRLSANDTDMYYSNYSTKHYNDLLFSESGYSGPSGQNIISAYQYYQQESGGTFFFTGKAHGWVTADNEAIFYGENDPDANFDDKNVPALVLEAVTKLVRDQNIDLAEYDKVDTYDYDNDGVLNEPDGIIDHVMIFHSSIGEEAGGGVLADDAIWSHRYFVFGNDNQPVPIPGTTVKLYGYTINPIDAATGVVVHEFGHDLGLDDEYDIDNGAIGSPVSDWSVMDSGSWLGFPGGTSPATFSALARDYLSERYQGNWINQLEVDFSALTTENIDIVAANNHQSGVNQVKVILPPEKITFGTPAQGQYQYYSGKSNELDSRMSFVVTLPSGNSTLAMTARWDIETAYDYMQVLVNGTPIEGSHTDETNNVYSFVNHFISGNSANVNDAYGPLSWVDLRFDLTDYAEQTVTIELRYKTDAGVLEYGFVADRISVIANSGELFFSGAESIDEVQLNGFSRISNEIDGKGRNYYVQLRNYSGTDEKLANIGYELGVLLWYRDQNISDNKVNDHPGKVFIGVVDADQNLIQNGLNISGTGTQLRDAAFSLFDQKPKSGDDYLTNNMLFSDCENYSSPLQPESGIILPKLGFAMEVKEQHIDSDAATIKLSAPHIVDTRTELSVSFSVADCNISDRSEVNWLLSEGAIQEGVSIVHTFSAPGKYQVAATYEVNGSMKILSKEVTVGNAIIGNISFEVTDQNVVFSSTLTGGFGEFNYRWDFGDNSEISQSASPTHIYTKSGTYRISLEVSDDTQQIYSFSKEVDIVVPLSAEVNANRSNLLVSFQSIITGGDENYSYQWDFGDGATATVASPSHSYSQAGTFSVTLVVTDGEGQETEVVTSVSVTIPVVAPSRENKSSSGGSIGLFALFALFSLLLVRVLARHGVIRHGAIKSSV